MKTVIEFDGKELNSVVGSMSRLVAAGAKKVDSLRFIRLILAPTVIYNNR